MLRITRVQPRQPTKLRQADSTCSKSTTTSNWVLRELTQRQFIYTGNDSFAALKIMEALQAEGHLERLR